MELRVQLVSAIFLLVFSGIAALLVWTLHRQWWAIPQVRKALWMVPAVGLGMTGLWVLALLLFGPDSIAHVVGLLVGFMMVSLLLLAFVLPFTGLTQSLERLVLWIRSRGRKTDEYAVGSGRSDDESVVPAGIEKRMPIEESTTIAESEESGDRPADPGRRSFLTTATAALPVLAVGSSGIGVARSAGGFTYPEMSFGYKNLHPDLEGLKILQISDMHLGYFVRLGDLERLLVGAERHQPDLVVVTGDFSDDLTVYTEGLRMIEQLKPKHGAWASLGNHEYHRGVDAVKRSFDATNIPLLVSESQIVPIGESRLRMAGADDPVGGSGEFEDPAYLQETVLKALGADPDVAEGAPGDEPYDFTLLMTHRPTGFDTAAPLGVELTLAGHTHAGGQLGWNGRSLVEGLGIGKYMWGLYEKNDGATKLYTTCGAGHWLPFRLGVPREVPVITLERKQTS